MDSFDMPHYGSKLSRRCTLRLFMIGLGGIFCLFSDMPQSGFEPAQNPSTGLWSCAVVITTTPQCHCITQHKNTPTHTYPLHYTQRQYMPCVLILNSDQVPFWYYLGFYMRQLMSVMMSQILKLVDLTKV